MWSRSVLCLALLAPCVQAQFSQPSYTATQTFQEQVLGSTSMPLAFDGASYWTCTGGSVTGVRMAQYDLAFALVASYSPGISFRGVFTDGDVPPVYARGYNSSQIQIMTAPGVFGPHVSLSGGTLDSQSSVSFDGSGNFIALRLPGVVGTWSPAGTWLSDLTLTGFGSMGTESSYPQNRGVVFAHGHYMTYSATVLSAWDLAGTRVDTTTLTGAGSTSSAHFSFCFADGLIWVIDDAGGTYRGYDVSLGLACSVTGPPSPASGDLPIQLDSTSPTSPTVDATFDHSTDGGASWQPCTAAPTSPLPNPALGIATGAQTFEWSSAADGVGVTAVATGVLVQATVDDGGPTAPTTCVTAPFDVDNLPPPPTCTITPPPGISSGDLDLSLDTASPSSPTVDVAFAFSTDGGVTYSPCTAAPGSPLANPAVGLATGAATFRWASRTDGVGLALLQPGVLVEATVDDGAYPTPGICTTTPFDVDNTSICGGICGDCNLNSVGPDIVDALETAQLAAGLVSPTLEQTGCCDVDSTGSITVLDALQIAQEAVSLPVILTCP